MKSNKIINYLITKLNRNSNQKLNKWSWNIKNYNKWKF